MSAITRQLLAWSLIMMLMSLPSPALAQGSAPLPSSTGAQAGGAAQDAAKGDEAIYCRPPEPRTDSRLWGPKVCLPVAKWKELRANGQDISADGHTIVQSRSDDPAFSGRQ
jgi:hypothetical protein